MEISTANSSASIGALLAVRSGSEEKFHQDQKIRGEDLARQLTSMLFERIKVYYSSPYTPSDDAIFTYRIQSEDDSRLEAIVNENIQKKFNELVKLPGNECLKVLVEGKKASSDCIVGYMCHVFPGEFEIFVSPKFSKFKNGSPSPREVGEKTFSKALESREKALEDLKITAEKAAKKISQNIRLEIQKRLMDPSRELPCQRVKGLVTYTIPKLKRFSFLRAHETSDELIKMVKSNIFAQLKEFTDRTENATLSIEDDWRSPLNSSEKDLSIYLENGKLWPVPPGTYLVSFWCTPNGSRPNL